MRIGDLAAARQPAPEPLTASGLGPPTQRAPSGFDETLPALAAESFQGLAAWTGREPATASTVRPVARARRRPDTTDERPAVSRGAEHQRAALSPTSPGASAVSTAAPPARWREGPQSFTPMADFGLALPPLGAAARSLSAADVMRQAVDTVAHQVPARLVVGLEFSPEAVTILHARGDGDRALRAGRSDVASWPPLLDLSRPNRVRLATDPLVTWWRDQAGVRHALEVRAAMWSSLEAPPSHAPNRLALLVIDPPRASGFTESELSALCYLTRVVAPRLG